MARLGSIGLERHNAQHSGHMGQFEVYVVTY